MTSDYRIKECSLTDDSLPEEIVNPESAYTNAIVTRIYGKQGG